MIQNISKISTVMLWKESDINYTLFNLHMILNMVLIIVYSNYDSNLLGHFLDMNFTYILYLPLK